MGVLLTLASKKPSTRPLEKRPKYAGANPRADSCAKSRFSSSRWMITCGFVSMVQSEGGGKGGALEDDFRADGVDRSQPSHILGVYVYLRVTAVDADDGVPPVGRWRRGDAVLHMYPIEQVGDASTCVLDLRSDEPGVGRSSRSID